MGICKVHTGDQMILFMHLLAITRRDDNASMGLEHESTLEPTTLYRYGLPQKFNKPILMKWLLDIINISTNITVKTCVKDGHGIYDL